MDCGRQVKESKPKADPRTCQHPELCNAKSSKTTHRVTCAHCQEVLYEEPQADFKARGCEAPGFEHATSSASSRVRPFTVETRDATMTKTNALIIAKMFPAFVLQQLQGHAPDDIIRESTLKKILEDAIDSTLELDTDEPTAHMAVAESSEVTESTDDDAEAETTLK